MRAALLFLVASVLVSPAAQAGSSSCGRLVRMLKSSAKANHLKNSNIFQMAMAQKRPISCSPDSAPQNFESFPYSRRFEADDLKLGAELGSENQIEPHTLVLVGDALLTYQNVLPGVIARTKKGVKSAVVISQSESGEEDNFFNIDFVSDDREGTVVTKARRGGAVGAVTLSSGKVVVFSEPYHNRIEADLFTAKGRPLFTFEVTPANPQGIHFLPTTNDKVVMIVSGYYLDQKNIEIYLLNPKVGQTLLLDTITSSDSIIVNSPPKLSGSKKNTLTIDYRMHNDRSSPMLTKTIELPR